jgi:flagellar basal-body rod modification protein FlgD
MDIGSVYGPPKAETKIKDKNDTGIGAAMGDFLNLFVTQLKNQDPLSPMEGADFLAQTAQITSVEQLTKLNQNTRNSLAASLLGKQIEAQIPAAGTSGKTSLHSGIVTKVDYSESGEPLLGLADGTVVKLGQLKNMSVI